MDSLDFKAFNCFYDQKPWMCANHRQCSEQTERRETDGERSERIETKKC